MGAAGASGSDGSYPAILRELSLEGKPCKICISLAVRMMRRRRERLGLTSPLSLMLLSRLSWANQALTDGLVAYWRLDEAAVAVRMPNLGSATLTDNNTVGSAAGNISALAAAFVTASSEYLRHNERDCGGNRQRGPLQDAHGLDKPHRRSGIPGRRPRNV